MYTIFGRFEKNTRKAVKIDQKKKKVRGGTVYRARGEKSQDSPDLVTLVFSRYIKSVLLPVPLIYVILPHSSLVNERSLIRGQL